MTKATSIASQGGGTFVSDFRSQSHLLEVHNIADEIALRGHKHSSQVIRQSLRRARGEVAKALHVEQGTEVVHLLLVHAENSVPIQLEDRHVLASFAPGCLQQDFASVTPSAYLTSIAAAGGRAGGSCERAESCRAEIPRYQGWRGEPRRYPAHLVGRTHLLPLHASVTRAAVIS